MRIITILLTLLLLLNSCEKKSSPLQIDNDHVNVLCTTVIIGDVASYIGGEHIDVTTLISGNLDPHSYEIVKGDNDKFNSSDLVLSNGLGLEQGSSLFYLLKDNDKVVFLGDLVMEEAPEDICIVDYQPDPHIWMDISLWKRVVVHIVTLFGELDEAHEVYFKERGEELLRDMDRVDSEIKEILGEVPLDRRYLLTVHDAFNYFVRRYLATEDERKDGNWILRQEAPEGLSPEANLSSTDIQRVLDYVVETGVGVIFPESNVNLSSFNKIISVAREKGLDLEVSDECLYSDTLGGETYLGMMRYNAEVIKKHLK